MKKIVHVLFVLILLLITGQLAYTYSNSAPPSGYTNAPGESNCTSCHTSTLITSGTLWSNITLTTTVSLSSLQPNTTYPISLTFSDPVNTKYGFELVALPTSATASTPGIGNLVTTNTQTEVNTSSGRQYMSHSALGTAAPTNTKTWTFNYTTPTSFSGGINFYVVVNSTDDDGSNSGDQIYAKVFSSTVLPVKWLSYGVTHETSGNTITWATATETNNSHFEIERSVDTHSWERIASVASKGNGNISQKYSYTDDYLLPDDCFYRIKQVDFDGKYDYSKVLVATNRAAAESFYYNSANRTIHLNTTSQVGPATLYTLNGTPVLTSENGSTLQTSELENGIYLLKLPSGNMCKLYIY